MSVQRVAQIFGVVFILIAIIGFVTSGMSMESDPEMAAKIFGLFAVNAVHNGVHLGFGIWGVLAARGFESARNYCRISGVLYALLVVVGVVAPDSFGLVPLGGHDIWLHGLLAGGLIAAGFTARARE